MLIIRDRRKFCLVWKYCRKFGWIKTICIPKKIFFFIFFQKFSSLVINLNCIVSNKSIAQSIRLWLQIINQVKYIWLKYENYFICSLKTADFIKFIKDNSMYVEVCIFKKIPKLITLKKLNVFSRNYEDYRNSVSVLKTCLSILTNNELKHYHI